jgi:SAM-dependent methyltransferase
MRAADFLLSSQLIYRGFRRITGSGRVNREFVEKYVRPRDGDAILDIGCGPAGVLELMPRVQYTGIDRSPSYIAAARRRFGQRATFLCCDLTNLERREFGDFDAIISMGVIHHLNDDEAVTMLGHALALLKPGGRFVSYDPCFTEPQHQLARWIHKLDRGAFVRFDKRYEELISLVFSSYRRYIRTDLCTVPATVIIFECESPGPGT